MIISEKLCVNNYINKLIKKNKIVLEFVDERKLNSNAAIFNFNSINYIFISKNLDNRLLLLVFMHEYAHIKTKILNYNKFKYNRFTETIVNLFALMYINRIIKVKNFYKFYFYAIISENLLFNKFKELNYTFKLKENNYEIIQN
jgi:hypothetical protein